jgi:hypothetical protein
MTTAPAEVHQVLRSPGASLDPQTRRDMEARLGHDLSQVRVHADAAAGRSADSAAALAYTVGRDVVFAAGGYTPHTEAGRRLLAHELTHVVQQRTALRPASLSAITVNDDAAAEREAVRVAGGGSARDVRQRGGNPTVSRQEAESQAQQQPTVELADAARQDRLRQLLEEIVRETDATVSARSELEMLPAASSLRRAQLDSTLTEARSALVGLLEERVDLLRQEIASLRARIGPTLASSMERPELDPLGRELDRRERELADHERQLRPLRRWQTRRQLKATASAIAETDVDIATAPPHSLPPEAQVSDPFDPRIQALVRQQAALQTRQHALVASLTSTALRYRQADPRWGKRRYGTSPKCTNVAKGGCGPTSLAILLNYLFQEDPELAAGGDLEFVRPPETADYAATHGRVCNHGTEGDTMVTGVDTAWPSCHGAKVSLDEAVAALRSGQLVIFRCKGCTGTTSAGGTRTYGGHFMVLNGVNGDATEFTVLDPARSDVVRISRQELQRPHTKGLWTVTRK